MLLLAASLARRALARLRRPEFWEETRAEVSCTPHYHDSDLEYLTIHHWTPHYSIHNVCIDYSIASTGDSRECSGRHVRSTYSRRWTLTPG